jgi:hypothetical protein
MLGDESFEAKTQIINERPTQQMPNRNFLEVAAPRARRPHRVERRSMELAPNRFPSRHAMSTSDVNGQKMLEVLVMDMRLLHQTI